MGPTYRDTINAQAHDFTVADTHQEACELWAIPELRTSICAQLGRPDMDRPRMPDLFLQLTTSLLAQDGGSSEDEISPTHLPEDGYLGLIRLRLAALC